MAMRLPRLRFMLLDNGVPSNASKAVAGVLRTLPGVLNSGLDETEIHIHHNKYLRKKIIST